MQSRPRRRAFPCGTRITHNEEKRNFLCCQIKKYEKNFFFPIKEFTFVATTDKKNNICKPLKEIAYRIYITRY
uniref:hypothetical protein n=1 Tax=Candidatus Limisoma sp. TaxID=3076476 RepID=UPI0040288185